jgi:hypothetical protein
MVLLSMTGSLKITLPRSGFVQQAIAQLNTFSLFTFVTAVDWSRSFVG